ncbi:MAG: hypothetical protein R2939_19185 [Kofleriaceae bacterium]
MLCNVTQGSPEVEFFEDFYIDIFEDDAFSLFNGEFYGIATPIARARSGCARSAVPGDPASSTCAGG